MFLLQTDCRGCSYEQQYFYSRTSSLAIHRKTFSRENDNVDVDSHDFILSFFFALAIEASISEQAETNWRRH